MWNFRSLRPKKRRGTCRTPTECSSGMVFWPQDSKCYTLHTRGPCAKGKLITLGKSRIAECKVSVRDEKRMQWWMVMTGSHLDLIHSPVDCFFQCDSEGELAQYFYRDGTCHEHFTIGPCDGNGKLFLPGGRCGCHVKLPHYHEETDQCYEIGESRPVSVIPQWLHSSLTLPDHFRNDRTMSNRPSIHHSGWWQQKSARILPMQGGLRTVERRSMLPPIHTWSLRRRRIHNEHNRLCEESVREGTPLFPGTKDMLSARHAGSLSHTQSRCIRLHRAAIDRWHFIQWCVRMSRHHLHLGTKMCGRRTRWESVRFIARHGWIKWPLL